MKAMVDTSWKIAEKAVKELPPYLGDAELTPQRLYERNRDQLSSEEDARVLLEKLVEAGELRTEERRNMKNGKAKGGSRIKVYIAVKQDKA